MTRLLLLTTLLFLTSLSHHALYRAIARYIAGWGLSTLLMTLLFRHAIYRAGGTLFRRSRRQSFLSTVILFIVASRMLLSITLLPPLYGIATLDMTVPVLYCAHAHYIVLLCTLPRSYARPTSRIHAINNGVKVLILSGFSLQHLNYRASLSLQKHSQNSSPIS